MTRRAPGFLYVLLFLWILVSMGYYVAGVAALNQKWFRGDRHGDLPFEIDDNGTVRGLTKEDKKAGLIEGDVLETLNDADSPVIFNLQII